MWRLDCGHWRKADGYLMWSPSMVVPPMRRAYNRDTGSMNAASIETGGKGTARWLSCCWHGTVSTVRYGTTIF